MTAMRVWPFWLAAIAVFGGWTARGWREGAADAAELRAALLRAGEREIQLAALQAKVNKEAADHEKELEEIAGRADAADAALGRLRKSILSAGGAAGDSCTTGCGDGRTEGEVLGDCAAEYRRVAGEADKLRAQLVTLQGWARTVVPRALAE